MTAQLLPNVIQYFYDSGGAPLAGGKLYSYQAGTTTPLATYTDEGAGTPNTNPIVLNAAGQASVWLGSGAYKFKLTDSLGSVQWIVDNVSYINPGSIDLTKIGGSIAGLALDQNGSGALDVQVDDVTLEVNTSGSNNFLQVKPGGLTSSAFGASNLIEILYKNVRDYSCPGLIESIPQVEWSNPTLLSTPSSVPAGAASVCKWSPNGEFLAASFAVSPFLVVYQMCAGEMTPLSNFSYSGGGVEDLCWSPCGDYLAIAYQGTPCIVIYQRFGNSFVALPTPASVPTGSGKQGLYISFSPNSDFLLLGWIGLAGSRGAILYERSVSSDITTTVTGTVNPNTNAFSLNFQTAGGPNFDVLCANNNRTIALTSNAITASATSTVPGTVFTDITTTSTLSGIEGPFSWSPDSLLLSALDISTGRIDVFFRADNVFSGLTPPDVSAYLGNIVQYSFSPDGNFLAVSLDVTPFILLFKVQSATFTQLSNPTGGLPPGAASCVVWSENSQYLLVGDDSGTSPFMTIYQVTNPTSVTPTVAKIANPSVVPAGVVRSGDWTQTKQYLAVCGVTSPYLQVYATSSVFPANGIVWIRGIPNV